LKTVLPAMTTGTPLQARTNLQSTLSKRRISTEPEIDYSHLERRETAKVLLIFMPFVLAFYACLLVTWFMKGWIRR
jgi:hypothetical protein